MACKFIWVESRFWMKIILQVEKWATCHWLLKCDLKTNTYGIWFLYALLVSFFWIFEVFLSHLWVFMILLDLFLNSCWNLLIWVFWRFSCNIWDFWIFIWANDPKLELELRKLANFWADWNLVLRTVRGYGADSPPFMELVHQRLSRVVVNRKKTLRTVRQRTADGPPEAVQNLTEAVSVGLQCKDSKADGPLGYRGQSANGQKGGSWLIISYKEKWQILNWSWVT